MNIFGGRESSRTTCRALRALAGLGPVRIRLRPDSRPGGRATFPAQFVKQWFFI
jgi:hypothetical protein